MKQMTSTQIILSILGGWITGWLVNYFSDVLPVTRKISRPMCSQCKANFAWSNYLLFRACPNGHRRNARVLLVQVSGLVASVYFFMNPPSKIGYLLGLFLLMYFGI